MSNLQLFRAQTVAQLFADVAKNLDLYRSGDFTDLLHDQSHFLDSSCTTDEEALKKITSTKENDNEVACCLHILQAIGGVSSYLARDERLWARLCHIELLEYARTRWPIPANDEKAVTHIKKHFFAKGARGIERDNAASRLWWMATICNKVEGLPLDQALTAFLHQSDVRANIVERPTTSQNATLLSSVVNKLHESYNGDKALYEREKFRAVMKNLNLEGGVRLLEVLGSKELKKLVEKVSK
ncbi:DUF6339 family protein [Limnohabitans lacus]|jgi:hypothetical protein|uniref:DUF6339 family protein n=1 Tax=Limnohabitans lacus TaxID=3045173 RepID=A0ABT6XA53_9BURK|nr:DUF6339 family protein [Limnohabitans sp. HM2-2]MDI9235015.1 DUF6339 family protein [Limnohabitans sp. HM2-2]